MSQIIIDVREPEEYQEAHVAGAINVTPAELLALTEDGVNNISKEANIIVYCRTGSRSSVAKHILEQHGYKNIINGINQQQVEATYLG